MKKQILSKYLNMGVFFLTCFISAQLSAQSAESEPAPAPTVPTATKSSSKDKVNVLDFEGEVIEGERKKPDLILQIAPQDLNFDSLLYNRNDFNDYLEVDQKTRPRFIIKNKK